jgi:hypothetical protein
MVILKIILSLKTLIEIFLKKIKSILKTLNFFQNIFFWVQNFILIFLFSKKINWTNTKIIFFNQKSKNYSNDTKSENMIINHKHSTIQLMINKHKWWFNMLNLIRNEFIIDIFDIFDTFTFLDINIWFFKIMKLIYHYLFIDAKQDHFFSKRMKYIMLLSKIKIDFFF